MEMNYNNLTIEGTNTLLSPIDANNLIVSGDLNLAGHFVNISGAFSREDGGDISGEGFLRVHKEEQFTGDLDLSHLGFMVRYDGTVDIAINRYAGMVDNNDRMSLNTYFEVNLNLEDNSQDLLGIGIALEEQDLNGMDLEKLSIFRADASDLSTWTPIGGVVEDGYIMLDSIPHELFQDDNNLSLDGYYTVGQRGCIYDDTSNYDPMAFGGTVINSDTEMFGGEYDCSYDFTNDLHSGANLVSFYSIDDDDNSVSNVMSSLTECYALIGEGAAASNTFQGWIGNLSDIERDKGYWIKCVDDDVYEHFNGKADTTSMTYSIHPGANLISFSGPAPTPIELALPSDLSCDAIIGEGEATSLSASGDWIGNLDNFKPWGGYWMKCSDSHEFSFQGHGALPRVDVEDIPVPEELAFEQSINQMFYFIEDIEDAQVGRDFIITKIGDDIVGSAPYVGEYSTIPLMGKWEEVPGFRIGQTVSLQLYNSYSGQYYYLRDQELPAFENLGTFTIGVMTQQPVIPEKFVLYRAYPNPFNPSTNIKFDIPSRLRVLLEIYNVNGQLVSTLNNKELDPGYYEMSWDASQFSSGAYFVRLSAGSFVNTQKLTLIK